MATRWAAQRVPFLPGTCHVDRSRGYTSKAGTRRRVPADPQDLTPLGIAITLRHTAGGKEGRAHCCGEMNCGTFLLDRAGALMRLAWLARVQRDTSARRLLRLSPFGT
jgi:hypothetical protein